MQRLGQPEGITNTTVSDLLTGLIAAWQAEVKENWTARIVVDVKNGAVVKIQTFPFVGNS